MWVAETAQWHDPIAGELPAVRDDMPAIDWESLRQYDVVFPLIHGPWGEDGTIQGLFEMADVRYVGAGVLASAVGMDKPFTKTVFSAGGLPQVPYVTILPGQWDDDRDRTEARIQALRLPVFVKPARAGSSSGVTKVEHADELDMAIRTAAKFDPKVIVEAFARGKRELECGVMQRPDGTPIASVVGEIQVASTSDHEFYDFESKYLDGSGLNIVPADIPETLSERIRTYAVQAFESIGCEGLARVDFFETDDGLVINEINTMPGFTPFSMFPLLWEASGVPYAELIERLIQLALNRQTGLR
ncbi:MAG: D-alanine--D-alanine ligase family protein, partial [Aeromicrobium sp.]